MQPVLVLAAVLCAVLHVSSAAPAPVLGPVVTEKRTILEHRIVVRAPEPTPFEFPSAVEKRDNAGATELSIIESILSVGVIALGQRLAFSEIVSELEAIVPTTSPTATEDVSSILASIWATATPTGYLESAVYLLLNGLANEDTLAAVVSGNLGGENSPSNTANPAPSQSIYPYKLPCDAPYSQSEATLREQIYIPSTFTYGQKPPVILIPGTGGRGGVDFSGNFAVNLANVDYADLVYINPAAFLLADVQLNSELAAYAINYISAISGNINVSVIAWSQGNINVQWATKYWPSTRSILSDHIAISPDYHGTTMANLIDPGNDLAYAPALLQQQYDSQFIATLRSNGGDSAYVPTTNVWSAVFDQIVEPQQSPNASAFLLDARGVGVTNAQVQTVCGSDSPAGFFQTHESMMSNSLSFALAVDALTHDGPGLVTRINTTEVCQQIAAPGLSVVDLVDTENIVVVAMAALLLYPSPVFSEPAISQYALKSPTSCVGSATTSTTSKVTKTKTTKVKTTKTKTTSTKTTKQTTAKPTKSTTTKTKTKTKTMSTNAAADTAEISTVT